MCLNHDSGVGSGHNEEGAKIYNKWNNLIILFPTTDWQEKTESFVKTWLDSVDSSFSKSWIPGIV